MIFPRSPDLLPLCLSTPSPDRAVQSARHYEFLTSQLPPLLIEGFPVVLDYSTYESRRKEENQETRIEESRVSGALA